MIKAQRQQRIIEILQAEGSVDVLGLARIMPEVSQVTLRRDIAELADAGALRRTHGGAVLPDAVLLKHPAVTAEPAREAGVDDLDAVILPPIPGRGGDALRRHIVERGIPFLAESAHQKGGVYLGPDNRAAGHALGRIAAEELHGIDRPRVLIVGHQELANTRDRVAGFIEGLMAGLGRESDLVSVNGQGAYKTALRVALDAMASSGPFDVALGVNDHSAIAIAEAAIRSDQNVAVYATGGESPEFVGRLANRNRIRAVAAFFPEAVGETAIDLLAGALSGKPLPEAALTPFAIVTADNLSDYYQEGDTGWRLIRSGDADSRRVRKLLPAGASPRVGIVPHFPTHDWYRGLIQAMKARAALYGIELSVIPPQKGISAETTRLRREIARTACVNLVAGETIVIGEGETNVSLAEEIRRTAYHEPERIDGLTIITNALDVLTKLTDVPGVKAILTSGEYQAADRCLVGPSLDALFERVRADRAFLAPNGLSRRFGASSMDERLSLAGSRLMKAARHTVVLADHTVLGEEANYRTARIDDIHEVITDSGALPGDRQALREMGVIVRVAGDEDEAAAAQDQRQDRILSRN